MARDGLLSPSAEMSDSPMPNIDDLLALPSSPEEDPSADIEERINSIPSPSRSPSRRREGLSSPRHRGSMATSRASSAFPSMDDILDESLRTDGGDGPPSFPRNPFDIASRIARTPQLSPRSEPDVEGIGSLLDVTNEHPEQPPPPYTEQDARDWALRQSRIPAGDRWPVPIYHRTDGGEGMASTAPRRPEIPRLDLGTIGRQGSSGSLWSDGAPISSDRPLAESEPRRPQDFDEERDEVVRHMHQRLAASRDVPRIVTPESDDLIVNDFLRSVDGRERARSREPRRQPDAPGRDSYHDMRFSTAGPVPEIPAPRSWSHDRPAQVRPTAAPQPTIGGADDAGREDPPAPSAAPPSSAPGRVEAASAPAADPSVAPAAADFDPMRTEGSMGMASGESEGVIPTRGMVARPHGLVSEGASGRGMVARPHGLVGEGASGRGMAASYGLPPGAVSLHEEAESHPHMPPVRMDLIPRRQPATAMGGVSASAAHPVHPGEGHMLPPARGAFVHPDPVPRIYGTAGPGAYLSSGPLPPRAPRADVSDPAIAGIDPRFDPAYAGIDPRFVGHGGFAHTGIPVAPPSRMSAGVMGPPRFAPPADTPGHLPADPRHMAHGPWRPPADASWGDWAAHHGWHHGWGEPPHAPFVHAPTGPAMYRPPAGMPPAYGVVPGHHAPGYAVGHGPPSVRPAPPPPPVPPPASFPAGLPASEVVPPLLVVGEPHHGAHMEAPVAEPHHGAAVAAASELGHHGAAAPVAAPVVEPHHGAAVAATVREHHGAAALVAAPLVEPHHGAGARAAGDPVPPSSDGIRVPGDAHSPPRHRAGSAPRQVPDVVGGLDIVASPHSPIGIFSPPAQVAADSRTLVDQGCQTTPDKCQIVPRTQKRKRDTDYMVQQMKSQYDYYEYPLPEVAGAPSKRTARHRIRTLEFWKGERYVWHMPEGGGVPVPHAVVIAKEVDNTAQRRKSAERPEMLPLSTAAAVSHLDYSPESAKMDDQVTPPPRRNKRQVSVSVAPNRNADRTAAGRRARLEHRAGLSADTFLPQEFQDGAQDENGMDLVENSASGSGIASQPHGAHVATAAAGRSRTVPSKPASFVEDDDGFLDAGKAEGSLHPCKVRMGMNATHWLCCDIRIPPSSFNTPERLPEGRSVMMTVMADGNGRLSTTLNGQTLSLHRGDMVCVPTGSEYSLRNDSRLHNASLKLVMVNPVDV